MVLNPNIPMRQAYIAALTAATGLPVWHKKVPKDVSTPQKYILLQSQSKRQFEPSKCCWEWETTISADITYINTQGYSNAVQIDTTEEQVINAIEALVMPGWYVKNIQLVDSTDLDDETDTQSVERRILTYNFWVWPV